MHKMLLTGIILLLTLSCCIPVSTAEDTCSLSITSVPAGGAVFIDRIPQGLTPAADIRVTCEDHQVLITRDGFDDFTRTTGFTSGAHQEIIADLKGRVDRGALSIITKPQSAELFVDDRYRGNTPVTVYNLQPGRHSVLLMADGFEQYRDVVSVSAGATQEYTEYLVPLPGSGFVSFTSNPDMASVTIDGVDAGLTPTPLRRAAAGNHTVILSKKGYWNYSGIVRVTGGKSILINADLTKIPTTFTVYANALTAGTGLYLNGTFKGYTPMTLTEVPAGDYLLEFRDPQGPSVNQTMSFAPGARYEISASTSPGAGNSTITSQEWVYLNASYPAAQPGWVVNSTPVIDRTFTWIAKGHEATITIDIPQDLYDYYQNQPHTREVSREEFSRYAINEKDRQYIRDLVEKLMDKSDFKTYGARSDYHNVVSFVQSLDYLNDLDPATHQTTDYWKYPIETLADNGGDCEDTSILTAALLKEMGYDVAVVLFNDHAGTAVACTNCNGYYYPVDGKRYYYLETTGAGYSLGIMDIKYQNAAARVIPL